MKIAISGKGGVGKTTIAGALAILCAKQGKRVIAVDADSSPNLANTLGVDSEKRKSIIPLSRRLDIIEERTGVKPGMSYGKMFIMNPKVDDLVNQYSIECMYGIKLLVLGTVTRGGSGCFCPENTLLRTLMRHLIFKKDEVIIIDMEAGIEHLGRGTAEKVDNLIVVVEPSIKSIEITEWMKKLANDIGIKKIMVVLNKCNNKSDRDIVEEKLEKIGLPLIGVLPRDNCIMNADIKDQSPFENPECNVFLTYIGNIKNKIMN